MNVPAHAHSDRMKLKPAKKYTLFLIAITGAFLTFAIWGLGKYAGPEVWTLVAVYAIILLILMLWMHPNSSYMVLTRQGFQIRQLFRTTRYRWDQVERFSVADGPLGQKETRFYLRDAPCLFAVRTIPDSYGLGVEELTELLTQRLNRSRQGIVEPQGETCLIRQRPLFSRLAG